LVLKNIYSHNYKLLVLFPLLFSVVMIFLAFVSPGLQEGLDIRGGTMIVVQADKILDNAALEAALKKNFDLEDLSVTGTGAGVRVQFSQSKMFAQADKSLLAAESLLASNPEKAKADAATAVQGLNPYAQLPKDFSSLAPDKAVVAARDTYNRANESFKNSLQETILSALSLSPSEARFQNREVGSALGKAFWQNAINVTIIALVLITILIFVFFRELIPSLAIVEAAIIDILAALGGMALFGIPLSLSTIPALLMLIGYSVDTDILLTTRLLKKREGTPEMRAHESMITGLTMSSTALVASLVMLLLANYYQITVIFEIATVVFFGIIGDMISTWFMNAPVLLWYVKRNKKEVF